MPPHSVVSENDPPPPPHDVFTPPRSRGNFHGFSKQLDNRFLIKFVTNFINNIISSN